MDEQKLTAFSLKYEGKTYKEIAEDPRVNLTDGTLATYFTYEGMWGPEYRIFCKERNKLTEAATLSVFRGVAEIAANAMMSALRDANEEVKKIKNKITKAQRDLLPDKEVEELFHTLFTAHNRAAGYAERVLDRAGMPIIKKVEVEDHDNNDIDDINKVLEDAGIDPESIRYKSKAPARTEGTEQS